MIDNLQQLLYSYIRFVQLSVDSWCPSCHHSFPTWYVRIHFVVVFLQFLTRLLVLFVLLFFRSFCFLWWFWWLTTRFRSGFLWQRVLRWFRFYFLRRRTWLFVLFTFDDNRDCRLSVTMLDRAFHCRYLGTDCKVLWKRARYARLRCYGRLLLGIKSWSLCRTALLMMLAWRKGSPFFWSRSDRLRRWRRRFSRFLLAEWHVWPLDGFRTVWWMLRILSQMYRTVCVIPWQISIGTRT